MFTTRPTHPPTTVFFRDDDVGILSPALRTFAELTAACGAPVNYQAIPLRVTDDAARLLRELRRSHPSLVQVNQHGFRHDIPHGLRPNAGEFGGGIPYQEQLKWLETGRSMLMDSFGEAFGPEVFTPPFHKYDGNTLLALRSMGVRVLSTSIYPMLTARMFYAAGRLQQKVRFLGHHVPYHPGVTPIAGLRELACGIDVDEDRDRGGNRILKDVAALMAEFERCRARTTIVGIMLHHETYTTDRKAEILREFIAALRADASICFATIEEAARKAEGERGIEPHAARSTGERPGNRLLDGSRTGV
jgi:hypothetical protein